MTKKNLGKLLVRKKGMSFKDMYAAVTGGIPIENPNGKVRVFETGATRDGDDGKFDYEGFLSPLVIERFGQYMHLHRHQADGKLRDSDNWQRGIPKNAYIKSAWRHFLAWWKLHRGHTHSEGLEDTLCAMIFNASGYLHELLKQKECKIK